MQTKIELGRDSYLIQIENSFESLQLPYQKIFIITDSNVAPLYAETLKAHLEKSGASVLTAAFEAGERQKNLETVQLFYRSCLAGGLDRKSCIVALGGGGVTGDIAGFVAATYLRGIDYIQVPTTLLAQADSSVGGKTGVDFDGGKNLIGAFWQPKHVYMNLSCLSTLPDREFAAGMAEIVKHGIIYDKAFYDFLSENREQIAGRKSETIAQMLEKNSLIKADVVAKDEKEMGLRAILNFGHTVGHGIETAMGFQLLHGECVAIGMAASLYISVQRGYISEQIFQDIKTLLSFFGLPVSCSCDKEQILEAMKKDKKRENQVQKFILAEKIGSCRIVTDVTDEELDGCIRSVIKERTCVI